MTSKQHEWNDKWLDLASKVLAAGFNMSQVASAINNVHKVNLTKNSVIGKINRAKASGDVRFTVQHEPEKLNGKPLNFLFEGWKNGLGTNEIADYYGIHRNTVAKKATEYGLDSRGYLYGLQVLRSNKKEKKPDSVKSAAYKCKNVFENPKARGVDFLELKHNQCHFPVGDGPFVFCGADVDPGSSTPYCNVCKTVVYRPSDLR